MSTATAAPPRKPPTRTARADDQPDFSRDIDGFTVELWDRFNLPASADRRDEEGIYVRIIPGPISSADDLREPTHLLTRLKGFIKKYDGETIVSSFPAPTHFTPNPYTFFVPYTERFQIHESCERDDPKEAFRVQLEAMVKHKLLINSPIPTGQAKTPAAARDVPVVEVEEDEPPAAPRPPRRISPLPPPQKQARPRSANPITTVVGIAEDAAEAAYTKTFGHPGHMDHDIQRLALDAAISAFSPDKIAGYDDNDYATLAKKVLEVVSGTLCDGQTHASDCESLMTRAGNNVRTKITGQKLAGPQILSAIAEAAGNAYDKSILASRPERLELRNAIRDGIAAIYPDDVDSTTPGFRDMVDNLADTFLESYKHIHANPQAARDAFVTNATTEARTLLAKSGLGGSPGTPKRT